MVISKKILCMGLFATGTSLFTQTMQNPPQKDFSKLAFCQSIALWTFGSLIDSAGEKLLDLTSLTKPPHYKHHQIGLLCRGIGITSVGLGFLSTTYILISKHSAIRQYIAFYTQKRQE
jgi:hypothetical protein